MFFGLSDRNCSRMVAPLENVCWGFWGFLKKIMLLSVTHILVRVCLEKVMKFRSLISPRLLYLCNAVFPTPRLLDLYRQVIKNKIFNTIAGSGGTYALLVFNVRLQFPTHVVQVLSPIPKELSLVVERQHCHLS